MRRLGRRSKSSHLPGAPVEKGRGGGEETRGDPDDLRTGADFNEGEQKGAHAEPASLIGGERGEGGREGGWDGGRREGNPPRPAPRLLAATGA